MAHTCEKGNLHFNEDLLIIEKEYIDKEKKRFFPIITDLNRTTQPVIRYKLDDIIHEKLDCQCQLKSTAIEMIFSGFIFKPLFISASAITKSILV